MDESLWTLMNIIGPAILLVLLIWLVMRSRRRTSCSEPAADGPWTFSRSVEGWDQNVRQP